MDELRRLLPYAGPLLKAEMIRTLRTLLENLNLLDDVTRRRADEALARLNGLARAA